MYFKWISVAGGGILVDAYTLKICRSFYVSLHVTCCHFIMLSVPILINCFVCFVTDGSRSK